MKRLAVLILLASASATGLAQQPFATHYHLDSFYSISSIGQHTVQVGNAYYVSYNVQRQPTLDTTTNILAKIDQNGAVVFSKRMNHERANTLTMMRTSDNHLLIYHSRQTTGSSAVTYVTKMDTALNVVWSVSGISGGLGLAERSGDYVVYGGTNTSTAAGGSLRVARLNKSTGALLGQSSTALPGAGGAPDFAHPLSNGNHLLTGLTNGTGSGNAHSFIASVNPTGGAAWATSLENVVGQNYEFSTAVEDGAGNVYVAGRYEEGPNTITSGILVKLSPTGALIFARRFALPPATDVTHSVAFYASTLSGGVIRLYGRAFSSNTSTLTSFRRLVQLRLDTTGAVQGQKLLNVSLAPFSTQNLFGGAQSPYFETADGRLVFTTTSFRECVSNQQNIFIAQTAAGTASTGCDSTTETAALIDSAHTAAATTISIFSNTATQTAGAGLTTLGYLDRPLTRTRYCDCARLPDGTTSVMVPKSDIALIDLVPNPATTSFRLTGFPTIYSALLQVVDASGRLVWTVEDYRGETLTIPSALLPGLYAVRIIGNRGEHVVRRLVVQ